MRSVRNKLFKCPPPHFITEVSLGRHYAVSGTIDEVLAEVIPAEWFELSRHSIDLYD